MLNTRSSFFDVNAAHGEAIPSGEKKAKLKYHMYEMRFTNCESAKVLAQCVWHEISAAYFVLQL